MADDSARDRVRALVREVRLPPARDADVVALKQRDGLGIAALLDEALVHGALRHHHDEGSVHSFDRAGGAPFLGAGGMASTHSLPPVQRPGKSRRM